MRLMRQQRYQRGSLRKRLKDNGTTVWEYRFRDYADGGRMKHRYLPTVRYPSEAHAWRALERFIVEINRERSPGSVIDPTFGTLIDRFVEEEKLHQIRRQVTGNSTIEGLQYSTACAYNSILEGHIRPRWGETPVREVRPAAVQEWLKQKPAAPKYKAKIKALMHRLFEKAMLWEMIELQRNPMGLVEIRGISKRRKRPLILTVDQCCAVLERLCEPYRTMVLLAQCTGLRASEILALRWEDCDFERLTLRVTRKVVNGRVSRVKTEYSEDELPLDPDFAGQLLSWRSRCPVAVVGWVFPNPNTGQPFYASEIQKRHLKSAGAALKLLQDGQAISLGWHNFRHTYRSLLDASGAPIGVQQKLMRHAQVATTMDIYGNALMESKREANSKVVQMVLKGQSRVQGEKTKGAAGGSASASFQEASQLWATVGLSSS